MSTSNEFDRPKCPSCGDVGTTGEYGYKKCSNCGWRWNQKYKTTGKHQIEYSVANGVTYEQIKKVRALLSIGQNVTNIAETTAVPIKVILKIKDSASVPILDGQEFEPVNVLKQLAFGNNPVTGEPLPADHLIKMSCVNRALLLGALTLSENETEKEVSNPKKEKSSIEDWTEFEEQQVVDLFLQGQSAEEIRIKLNKLAKSVRGKIRRFFGAPANCLYPLPKEKKQEALELTSCTGDKQDEGYKQRINILIGRPKNYGFAWTSVLDATLVSSFKEGKSVEYLMQEFGRNKNSIQLRLEYLAGSDIETMIAVSIEDRASFFQNTPFSSNENS